MLKFSRDPNVAEQQMRAIIFYLIAFGYVDGHFDLSEKTFVRVYIRQLVEARAEDAMPDADDETRREVVKRFVTHFHEVFEEIDRDVRGLFTEVVAQGEKVEEFVLAKLKLRSYEIFRSFDRDNQLALLDTIDELINADGKVHPEEATFREEVRALLDHSQPPADDPRSLLPPTVPDTHIEIELPRHLAPRHDNHPLFASSEHHYSADPVRIRKQAETDYRLIVQTMEAFDRAARPAGAVA